MRLFNSGMAQRIMASGAYPEDMPLENRMVSRCDRVGPAPGGGPQLRDP